MINCPNCGAENADNSNHCGNCGTKVQAGGGAKTMFGFAAISPEDMKKAAEEARAASEAAADKPKLQSPTLPTPSIPAPSSLGAKPAATEGTPKFNIPAPSSLGASDGSEVPTQMTPAVGAEEDDFGIGDTHTPEELAQASAQLEKELGASHTTQPEPAVTAPDPADAWGAPASTAPSDGWGAPASSLPSAAPEPAQSSMQPSGGFGGGGGGGFGGGFSGNSAGVAGEVRNPIQVQLLAMFTCGFYAIYFMFTVMNELNAALAEEKYNPIKEFLLIMVTCGAWGIYLWWRLAQDIVEVQNRWGVQPKFDAVILFVLNLVYISPWAIQESLNNAWENGRG